MTFALEKTDVRLPHTHLQGKQAFESTLAEQCLRQARCAYIKASAHW